MEEKSLGERTPPKLLRTALRTEMGYATLEKITLFPSTSSATSTFHFHFVVVLSFAPSFLQDRTATIISSPFFITLCKRVRSRSTRLPMA